MDDLPVRRCCNYPLSRSYWGEVWLLRLQKPDHSGRIRCIALDVRHLEGVRHQKIQEQLHLQWYELWFFLIVSGTVLDPMPGNGDLLLSGKLKRIDP